MNASRSLLSSAVALTFALFLLGTTFSIAFSQSMMVASLLLFVVVSIRDRHNPFAGELKSVYLVIGAFVLWEIVTALAGATPLRSLNLMREEWLFLIIPVGIWVLQKPEYQSWCFRLLLFGVVLIGIYGLFQHFTGMDLYKGKQLPPAKDFGYLISGTFVQRMTFANYYAITGVLLVALGCSKKMSMTKIPYWVWIAVGVLSLTVASLTFVRGAISAYIIGLTVLGFLLSFKHGVRIVALLAISLGAFVLVKPGLIGKFTSTITEEQDGNRVMSRRFIWGHTFDMIADRPLLGLGAGNFTAEYITRLPETAPEKSKHSHPHDDLLNVAAVSGLPGAVLFIAMWFVVLRAIWRKRKENPFGIAALAASVTFLAASVTEATFVDEEVRQLLMAVWAFGLFPYFAVKSQEKPDGENSLTGPPVNG